jgi:hypothetical protein
MTRCWLCGGKAGKGKKLEDHRLRVHGIQPTEKGRDVEAIAGAAEDVEMRPAVAVDVTESSDKKSSEAVAGDEEDLEVWVGEPMPPIAISGPGEASRQVVLPERSLADTSGRDGARERLRELPLRASWLTEQGDCLMLPWDPRQRDWLQDSDRPARPLADLPLPAFCKDGRRGIRKVFLDGETSRLGNPDIPVLGSSLDPGDDMSEATVVGDTLCHSSVSDLLSGMIPTVVPMETVVVEGAGGFGVKPVIDGADIFPPVLVKIPLVKFRRLKVNLVRDPARRRR